MNKTLEEYSQELEKWLSERNICLTIGRLLDRQFIEIYEKTTRKHTQLSDTVSYDSDSQLWCGRYVYQET